MWSKYNLIIICAGNNSRLVKNLFNDQIIENSYKETSISTILTHSSLKNNTARQIFLDNEILALLPISNTKTAIVWSIKEIMKEKNNLLLRKKIKFYVKNYLKNVTFTTNIEYKDLKFLIRNQYFQDRTLLFGDALHVLHPFVGQGFNMTLRDLVHLKKILSNKVSLGLDIGNSDTLSEFSNVTQPRNFVYSIGIDFLKHSFSSENYIAKNFRNKIISDLNKNHFAKDIFYKLADEGLKF